jgi:hypothetical protein
MITQDFLVSFSLLDNSETLHHNSSKMKPLWSTPMPTVTVKNIPADLYEKLKQSAQLNRRSINSEIVICIERAIRTKPIDPDAVLATARRLREKTMAHPISDHELAEAKAAGRP